MSGNTDKNRDINPKHKVHLHPPNPGHKKGGLRWTILIVVWTFAISTFISYFSAEVLKRVPMWAAFLLLFGVILIGIGFDIVGVAVTAASEVPFHSIASRRVPAARYAVMLIRNAEKVSNLCTDVVGDIAGVLSGAMAALIVASLADYFKDLELFLTLIITGTVAALTVGGKAVGKTFAIAQCNTIVYFVAKSIRFFEEMLGFEHRFKKNKK